jgi:hypothetical protein
MTHIYNQKVQRLIGLRQDQLEAINKKPKGWLPLFVRIKLDEEAGISNLKDKKKLSDMECRTNTDSEKVISQ